MEARIKELEDCIRELLKGGEHEGLCTTFGGDMDSGPCLKHLEVAEQREEAARKILEEA
jgi:hypothetical protein